MPRPTVVNSAGTRYGAGAEDHPRDRSWRTEAVLATGPLVFGVLTGLLYGGGPRCTFLQKLGLAWRRVARR